jgi:hypothetical protein
MIKNCQTNQEKTPREHQKRGNLNKNNPNFKQILKINFWRKYFTGLTLFCRAVHDGAAEVGAAPLVVAPRMLPRWQGGTPSVSVAPCWVAWHSLVRRRAEWRHTLGLGLLAQPRPGLLPHFLPHLWTSKAAALSSPLNPPTQNLPNRRFSPCISTSPSLLRYSP